jgi:NAD(P)H-hydrate epimerase
MTPIPCSQPQIPAVTAAEMAEVDRLMTEEVGVDLLQMMELAGGGWPPPPATASSAATRAAGACWSSPGRRNGGGGLAAARRLHGWCADVEVWTSRPGKRLRGGAHQHRSLEALGVPLHGPDGRGRCRRPTSWSTR